jgi:glutamate racemase
MTPDPSSELPIAMFDSGVGGLTVLHECLVSLPEEDYVYLGDDARFPYGARASDELQEHVEQVSRFLLERGAKLLVIACNSAASAGQQAARAIAAEAGVEVVAVIEPEAEIAAALTDNGNVGVLATPATVRSGAYLRALANQHRALTVTEVEAPDLAAVIQRGFPFSDGVVDMVRSYCEPLKRAEVDTVILGCTHYPLVRPMLQRVLGREVRLVTAGHAIAATVERQLASAGLARTGNEEGTYRFLCTDDPDSFRTLGTRFLQMPLGDIERVDLP